MKPVGETGLDTRRRRSNRPGNSQANGPQVDGTLESSGAAFAVFAHRRGKAIKLEISLIAGISQVLRQRGLIVAPILVRQGSIVTQDFKYEYI